MFSHNCLQPTIISSGFWHILFQTLFIKIVCETATGRQCRPSIEKVKLSNRHLLMNRENFHSKYHCEISSTYLNLLKTNAVYGILCRKIEDKIEPMCFCYYAASKDQNFTRCAFPLIWHDLCVHLDDNIALAFYLICTVSLRLLILLYIYIYMYIFTHSSSYLAHGEPHDWGPHPPSLDPWGLMSLSL